MNNSHVEIRLVIQIGLVGLFGLNGEIFRMFSYGYPLIFLSFPSFLRRNVDPSKNCKLFKTLASSWEFT